MGGNSGGNSGGNGGNNRSRFRAQPSPIVTQPKKRRSILEYSPTYQVVKAIGTAIKNIGTGNKTVKSGDTYGGKTKYGYNERAEKSNYVNRNPLANRNGGDGSNIKQANIKQANIKSEVQPKVASQMNAIKPITTPDGPTTVEMTNEDQKLTTKRKGRKSTILTSVTGLDSSPTLSKKTLLG